MTTRIGGTLVIEAEGSDKCQLCGEVEELRPYGPNGEQVCFTCGMLDEEAARRAFSGLLNGPSIAKETP